MAVIAPLALALAYHEPRRAVGALALLAIALSLCAAAVYWEPGTDLGAGASVGSSVFVWLPCSNSLSFAKWVVTVMFVLLRWWQGVIREQRRIDRWP